jgi:hypothetical protein
VALPLNLCIRVTLPALEAQEKGCLASPYIPTPTCFGWPLSLAVVPISYMTSGAMDKDDPPSWAFFDDQEQRARYEEWQSKPPTDRTPRVVPLSRK